MNQRERLTFGHGTHAAVPSRLQAVAATMAEPKPFRFTHFETWDWAWGGLLLFSILLFFRPQEQLEALGQMHASDLCAIVGLSAMVVLRLQRRQSITRVTPELLGVAALGLVILLTIPTSIWPGGSLQVFTTYYMQVALIFALMVNAVTSPKRIERLCWVIVLAFGYVSVRAWLDYARGTNLVEGSRVAGAAGGFFENPNDLALNMVAFLPLALMFVKRPGSSFRRVMSAAIVVLMLGTIVFTKSRSGMLGAAAMLGTFLIVSRSLTPGAIIGLVFAGLVSMPLMPQSFWERMSSIVNEEQDATGSRSERQELLERALNVFLEHPLTGVGAGQFQNFDSGDGHKWRVSHNALLQVAADVGMFGLAAFVFLIVRAFGAALWTKRALLIKHQRRPKARSSRKPVLAPGDGLTPQEHLFLQTHGAAMVACMVGWFVCALFASVAFNWTFYYLLGLSVSGRDVVLARARAYAEARAMAEREGEVTAA